MVIPESQRNNVIERIHEAHQGIDKCRLQAKSCVFWPNINEDVELRVRRCEICQENQKSQAHETLEPHEIPTRPWQVIGTYLFIWNGEEYLLICDYFSKFPIVRKIPHTIYRQNCCQPYQVCIVRTWSTWRHHFAQWATL